MGLFEAFAARSLERGAAVYESLADVTPGRRFWAVRRYCCPFI